MRAISLWQPFASLVELGAKSYETRGSPCDCIVQFVAIHAALKKDRACMAMAMTKPFRPVLKPHYPTLDDLPLGAVLCIVRITDSIPVETIRDGLSPEEIAFGDYRDGRFAWELELVERFAKPIPAKGKQGFWLWQTPEHLELSA